MKKRMRLEIKLVTNEGEFEGMLSPYGNVDSTGDVVEPGAYTKTLRDHGNKVPLLWQHKADSPVGELTLDDKPEGLYAKGKLLLELDDAKKALILMKAGVVRGLSIGFQTIRDTLENGVRHLKEIRLYEGSIVTFPANEAALISGIKARESKAADMMDMCEALCRMCSAMCESTIYYCWEAGGDMNSQQYKSALADCIACCDLCAGAMYRESASVAEICALCETICKKCAESCAAFSSDAVMAACADACLSCASCCADVVKSSGTLPSKTFRTPERSPLAPSTKTAEPDASHSLLSFLKSQR